jgi:microcystin-dependent protein
MVSLKHAFQSAKADGTDNTLVKPSNWNAEHNFTTAADGVVLGRAAGAGPGAVAELSNAAIISVVVPTGTVWMFGGAAAPTGWLLCQGQAVSRTTYAALFAAISTTFGAGDGSTTFNLPGFSARAPVGVGGGWVLGQQIGSNNNVQPRVYGNTSGVTDAFNIGGISDQENNDANVSAGSGMTVAATHTHAWRQNGIQVGVSGSIINNGNNVTDAFSIIQASLGINFMIKT